MTDVILRQFYVHLTVWEQGERAIIFYFLKNIHLCSTKAEKIKSSWDAPYLRPHLYAALSLLRSQRSGLFDGGICRHQIFDMFRAFSYDDTQDCVLPNGDPPVGEWTKPCVVTMGNKPKLLFLWTSKSIHLPRPRNYTEWSKSHANHGVKGQSVGLVILKQIIT
jgi:hypothetical protein